MPFMMVLEVSERLGNKIYMENQIYREWFKNEAIRIEGLENEVKTLKKRNEVLSNKVIAQSVMFKDQMSK